MNPKDAKASVKNRSAVIHINNGTGLADVQSLLNKEIYDGCKKIGCKHIEL